MKRNGVWLTGKRRKQDNKVSPPEGVFDFTSINNFKANQLQLSPADRTRFYKLLGLCLTSGLDFAIRRIARQTKHTLKCKWKTNTTKPFWVGCWQGFFIPFLSKGNKSTSPLLMAHGKQRVVYRAGPSSESWRRLRIYSQNVRGGPELGLWASPYFCLCSLDMTSNSWF